MRTGLLVLMLAALASGLKMCGHSRTSAPIVSAPNFTATAPTVATTSKPDFDRQIKPILQSRCQPCHFQGGKVYDKLPFERPETIKKLGTKLFTRIKDEKEQRLIREFLADQ